eukprot:765990-Hanusia_phi.AAC.1
MRGYLRSRVQSGRVTPAPAPATRPGMPSAGDRQLQPPEKLKDHLAIRQPKHSGHHHIVEEAAACSEGAEGQGDAV